MEKKIIINIGRQFGGGGLGVAYELGKKLGIPVYDKELIAKAAQDSGFSKGIFEESDEKKRLFSLSSIFASRFGDTENYMSDRGLFKMQSETIRKIAEQGSAIIVGRCADYILRGYSEVTNVFLYAEEGDKIKRAVEEYGISEKEAKKIMHDTDKARANYYNYHTGRKWGDPVNYNLCIDTGYISEDDIVDLILFYVEREIER